MNQLSIVMANLTSRVSTHINSFFKELQVKRFLAVVLVGFLLLTTNIATGRSAQASTEGVREQINQNDSQRPKTVGQWQQEARETEGSPGERLKKIGKESAEAVKDFGSNYVEGAQKTGSELQDTTVQTGKKLSNQVQR